MGKTARTPRKARKIDPGYLERAALHYLERYASSSQNLRRVLLNKVRRAAREHETDVEAATGWIDTLIARLLASKVIDDLVYARAKTQSLFRQGKPRLTIAKTLYAKGVARPEIDASLAALAEAEPNGDLAAAIAYARKRRLGPFRTADRDEKRQKDMAAMARRGFSGAIAGRVLAATDADAALALLQDD